MYLITPNTIRMNLSDDMPHRLHKMFGTEVSARSRIKSVIADTYNEATAKAKKSYEYLLGHMDIPSEYASSVEILCNITEIKDGEFWTPTTGDNNLTIWLA